MHMMTCQILVLGQNTRGVTVMACGRCPIRLRSLSTSLINLDRVMIALPRLPRQRRIRNLVAGGELSCRRCPLLRHSRRPRVSLRRPPRLAGLRSTLGWAHASIRRRLRTPPRTSWLTVPLRSGSALMAGRRQLMAGQPCQMVSRHGRRQRLVPRQPTLEPR